MARFRSSKSAAAGLLAVGLLALSGCNGDVRTPNEQEVARLRAAAGSGQQATQTQAAQADGFGGVITGRFVLPGQVPAPSRLTIDKDVEVCGKHNLTTEDLKVGPGDGLADVVLYIRRLDAGNVDPDWKSGDGQEIIFDNLNCRFEPHVAVVTTQDRLLIKNSDPVGHNTNVSLLKNSSFSEIIASNGSLEKRFSRGEDAPAGAICNIHPWMRGYLLIADNPYAVKTAADGSFRLENVPTGIELEFQVWHERAGRGKLAADGTAKIAGGRWRVRLAADQELNVGDLVVDRGTLGL